jgi:hypothetical protein
MDSDNDLTEKRTKKTAIDDTEEDEESDDEIDRISSKKRTVDDADSEEEEDDDEEEEEEEDEEEVIGGVTLRLNTNYFRNLEKREEDVLILSLKKKPRLTMTMMKKDMMILMSPWVSKSLPNCH